MEQCGEWAYEYCKQCTENVQNVNMFMTYYIAIHVLGLHKLSNCLIK